DRTPPPVFDQNLVDDRVELGVFGLVDDVAQVVALDLLVRRNRDHVEPVDFAKFALFGLGGTGHTREFLVEPEIVLEGDSRERLVLAANLETFLGLDRLMDTVRIAPAVHEPAGELVDDDDLTILDDIVLILVEEM